MFCDHWVSQARLQANQNQDITPCTYCHTGIPTREHEWWECDNLANSRQGPVARDARQDALFSTLAWPANSGQAKVAVSVATTRQVLLRDRYG